MREDRHGTENNSADATEWLRRAKHGAILAQAGRVMGLVALALIGWSAPQQNDVTSMPLRLAAIAMLWAGLWLYNHGKRLQSLPARVRLALDPRPPVLYLRSFKDDKAAAVRPLTAWLGHAVAFFGVTTEEEQLTEAMNEIGPFVAIGKPGEQLPELGASRMYVSDAEWKNRIKALMSRAQLLVLRAADTEGFEWEMRQAATYIAPERLIILLPFKEDEYGRFCKRSHGLLPCYLPEYQGAANIVGSRLRAMLYFDRDWTPHIQKLGVPFSLSLTPLVMAVKRALRPVIERLPSETMQTPVRSGFEFLRTIPAIVLVLFGLPELSGYAHLQLRASAVAHNDHGAALYEQHDLDGAIRELEQALRLNPDLVSAHVNLGMAWYEKGDLERALAAYDTALRVDPNVALLHNNFGLALRKKGDLNGAIAEFRRAARLEPTLTVAQENLCQTVSEQNNLEETASECREAVHLNPSSANAHYLLANVARLQTDYATAIGHYREAIRLSPASVLAHNNLGWTLAQTGRVDEAMIEYREAIRLKPDYPEAHGNLGGALLTKRDWAGATTEFGTALRFSPNAASLRYNLAFALNHQGKHAAAREELIQAYRLAPADQTIRRTYQQIIGQ